MGTMESNKDFGVLSTNETELMEKVFLSDKDDDNYLKLIADCIAIEEILQEESVKDNEVCREKSEVNKFYKETASAAVEKHFSRSLGIERIVQLTEVNMNEMQTSMRKTGTSKRKAKRKPTVTSLLPYRVQVTSDARVHPYAFMPPVCRPRQPSPNPPPPRVEMQYRGAYYFKHVPQQEHGVQYQTTRNSVKNNYEQDSNPPVYKTYHKGNTLVEVYSPTVGRGFNPRYNSQLMEPNVQTFLPPITGLNPTLSAAMADIHTFHRMAIEFNIPSNE